MKGSRRLHERVAAHAGVKVAMGSDASQAALKRLGNIKRIGVITPYMPLGDGQVRRFFTDCGFEIVRLKGLCCKVRSQSPTFRSARCATLSWK